jgi:peptide/nickel transport system substrate-binding protein
MMERDFSRRHFVQSVVLAGGGTTLAGCTTGNNGQPTAQGGLGDTLPPIEGAQVILDPAQFPKTLKESPDFAKRVRAGQLLPVAERVGQDPLVLKPAHSVGRYGGQIRRGYLGVGDPVSGARFCAGPDCLLYKDYANKQIIPNIARGFDLSDRDRVLTLRLRRGMKWSDGTPFTADDIIFWRDDINLNEGLGGSGTAALQIAGKDVTIKKIDTYTVQFISAVPNPLLPSVFFTSEDMNGLAVGGRRLAGGYAPKHYLTQFHPKYTSLSAANKRAKDAGFDDWTAYIRDRMAWELNTELPVLTPWTVTRPISSPPWELTANPYSIWVDNEGNQLPYIPKLTLSSAENLEVVNLRTVAGQYDFQDRNLTVANLPVLLRNQKRSDYTVHRAPSDEIEFGLRLNLAYTKDQTLGDLLREVDFRRALSLGINRDQINQAFALGTSKPTAIMPGDDDKYFPGPQWRTKWATLDVAQANSLLDKLGLTERDGEGYRMRPDGKGHVRLDCQSVKSFADNVAMSEMVKRHWQKIGIDMIVREITPNLSNTRGLANELMLVGHQIPGIDPFLRPSGFLPLNYTIGTQDMIGVPYAKWFRSGGRSGIEPPKSMDRLKEGVRLYQEGLQAPEDKRIEIGKQLYQLHADQVWSIGIIGFGLISNGIYTASNKLANVPGRIHNSTFMRSPSNTYPATFYYK